MTFDATVPYNDLPPLPPPLERIETAAILKKCINARVALQTPSPHCRARRS